MTHNSADRVECDSITQHAAASDVLRASMSLKRVLLVDDQAHVLRVLKLSLDRHGYEVDTALSGDIAVRLFREQPYDVVISGLDMPGMGGMELSAMLADEFLQDQPLLLVVGKDAIVSAATVTSANGNTVGGQPESETVEVIDAPLSLRWLVARLSEHFGHFD